MDYEDQVDRAEIEANTRAMRDEQETGSGYCSCACRDCFDIAITSDMRKRALCLLCKDADCDVTGDSECARDDLDECEG